MNKFYIFLSVTFFCIVTSGYSQTEINSYNAMGGGYSTTYLADYQCLGINPANLGWIKDNHKVSLGLLETGFSLYTNALNKSQVTNDLFDKDLQLSLAEKMEASSKFTDTRVWGQVACTWLGASYYNEAAGGFAISVRDRVFWNTIMNSQAAQFLFMGYHSPYFDSLVGNGSDTAGYSTDPQKLSKLYNGTKLHFIWYREYNFGYGRKIIDNDVISLYGGIGLKYLEGYGSFEFQLDGSNLTAYSSLGPEFNIDYNAPTPSQMTGTKVKKVGSGFGVDIGFTVMILKKIKIGLAVNDIGYINWNGNVYQANDVNVFKSTTAGIDNYNIFNAGQLIKIDGLPSDSALWGGLPSKKVNLATQFRGGASFRIIPQIEVGIDVVMPLNKKVPGSLDKPVLGFGLNLDPVKWVGISVGLVTGADVGTNIPVGLSFYPIRSSKLTWQLGMATRDLPFIFKREDIMASFAFGFTRFQF